VSIVPGHARPLALALACALLVGCATPPAYQRPQVSTPAGWKLEAPWRTGTPADGLPKGPWWEAFGDAELARLIARALSGNPTLAIAAARVEQARRGVDVAQAGTLPQVAASGRVARQAISANRPLTNYAAPNFGTVQNDFAPTIAASYEVDLSGRVRSTLAGASASAAQTVADAENVRLVLTADLAAAYFGLRAVDVEIDTVQRSLALQQRALALITDRYRLGAASGLDVAQQQALLDATTTQVDLLRRQRGLFENALGTLTGDGAPAFSLVPDVRELAPPAVPLGVPSDVLERRPDVAAAERAMAAANAQIGVAQAAFYPSVLIQPTLGFDSRLLPALFDAPSMLWSLGVTAVQTVIDGGRTRANVDIAQAGYQASVASYRRIVLTAMQEVQDGITSLAALERATAQARIAVDSARKVLALASARYEGGVATSLEVISAQQSLLTTERQLAQLLGQRLLACVFLVKALGGGWQPPAQAASTDPQVPASGGTMTPIAKAVRD
jgi:NodT family efflux transporter outer membrane factor (OMF) lipoprotein